MNSSTFKDFFLKDKILNAITACGFEHPSEGISCLQLQFRNTIVQHACIPRAITNKDVLCQAKSGMGKTAVFVISTLQMLNEEPDNDSVQVLVIAHTRELAFQIQNEYIRFTKEMPTVKTVVVYGGVNINKDRDALASHPAIVVGTPGRVLDLIKRGYMKVNKLRHFVVDECDHIINSLKMRKDLQDIFTSCPVDKQVMMFTATLPEETKQTCLKFLKDVFSQFLINFLFYSLLRLNQMIVI